MAHITDNRDAMTDRSSPTPMTTPDAEAHPPVEADEEPSDERQTAITNGADAVIRALEDAGVTTVFGVQGGAIMPVYDSLYDSRIRHVTMAHEQGAAHAADAYGIVTGNPGVCMATSGPGATNLITGIADANMDSDPMVALTGQVPTAMVGNDAFQETDTIGVTSPVTKHNYFADDATVVGDVVGEAVELARGGRPGPTLVDLPKDVTTTEIDEEPRPGRLPDTYRPQERADDHVVIEAAQALEEAERPVILSGGGVIKGEASEELRAFAIAHEIPVITTMPGIGSFPEDHPLSMEMAGMHGTGYANMAITHCDYLLGVGTRFDDRLTGGIETFAPGAEVAHIDIDPAEVSKNIEADYPLIGDAGTVLRQLDEAVTGVPYADEWRAQCQEWKEEYPMDYSWDPDGPLKPQKVVEAFDAATSDDTIVTTGVGQHQMWAAQYWTYTEPRTWVSSHGLGTMGYGVPAAVGAKLAAPDRDVICFDGDGSFLMTAQELAVAVREQLDITIAVLNNAAVGMVRQWQDAFFEGRHSASQYPWIPAFDKLAESFGAQGLSVESHDEVEETVELALSTDGPTVIDFHIDPDENVYPMVPSGGDNGQFALSEDQL